MANHPERYSDLYRDMANLIGDADVHKLWKVYGGLTVSFPSKLYSQDYTRRFIRENLGKMKPSEMAQELRLTERRIRQIIREIREEEINR